MEKLRDTTAIDWSYLSNRHVTNDFVLCYNTLQSAIGYRLACVAASAGSSLSITLIRDDPSLMSQQIYRSLTDDREM